MPLDDGHLQIGTEEETVDAIDQTSAGGGPLGLISCPRQSSPRPPAP